MLHIHNGDASGNIAKGSNLPGEHLVWREALVCGPSPSGLSPAEWRNLRAKHLAENYEMGAEDCATELLNQEQELAKFTDHDEVLLWFEHDLFCQLHLIYLLNWLSQREHGKTKLSLVCIGEFPEMENFRGLGELTVAQMSSLFPQRHKITAAEIDLGGKAWAAYTSADPQSIADLLEGDTAALPFLRAALEKHLARFPSLRNGLGLIENTALSLIATGTSQFGALFEAFGKEEPTYGLGDAQFMLSLLRLADAPHALLEISAGDNAGPSLGDPVKNSFALTAKGESVRRGNDDFVALNGIDQWLGGVHLQGEENIWRWDEQRRQLVARS